jgi:hypothetical protein
VTAEIPTEDIYLAPPILSFDIRQLVDESLQALPWKEVSQRHPDKVPTKRANAQSSAATLNGHLDFVRFALSQTVTRGLDETSDKVLSEQLGLGSKQIGLFGLQRLVKLLRSGYPSSKCSIVYGHSCSGSVSVQFPQDGTKLWRRSSAVSFTRLFVIVSMLRTYLNFPGKSPIGLGEASYLM